MGRRVAVACLGLVCVAGCAGEDGGDGASLGANRLAGWLHELGPDGRADREGEELVLRAGGAVTLALAPTSLVRVEGEVDGPSALSARIALAGPRLDRGLEVGRRAWSFKEAGAFTRTLALPDTKAGGTREGGATVLVELAFTAVDPDATARLTSVRAAPRERTPSVVFLSIDTLPARHLSLYGYGRETSPGLDRLAEEAIVFERCTANATYTTPSYCSQLTGLYSDVFLTDGGGDTADEGEDHTAPLINYHVPEQRWTLAERLASAGYRTAAFLDNPFAGPEFGLAQGFEVFDMSAAEIDAEAIDGGVRHIVPRALDWLDGLEGDEPFFLMLQVLDCHAPYLPPERVAGRFEDDALWDDTEVPVGSSNFLWGVLPERAVRMSLGLDRAPEVQATAPLIAAYDEEILDIDLALGEFLDALEQRGLFDDAIVIVSADHGESMGEHDWYFDHGTFYEEILHVPLIVRMPRGSAGGRRVADPVQLVDLAPTVIELAGLDVAEGAMHGRSLVPLLRDDGAVEPRPILAAPDVYRGAALVHGRWKLIETVPLLGIDTVRATDPRTIAWLGERLGVDLSGVRPDRVIETVARHPEAATIQAELDAYLANPVYELYDLEADPLELSNLADREPGELARMQALLEREQARVAEARVDVDTDGSGVELTPELREQLQSLGYTQDR